MMMTTNPVAQKGFHQLLDAAVDPMFVVDERGRVVALYDEAERVFGFTEAELLGEPLNQVIPPRFQHLAGSPETPPKDAAVNLFARRRDGVEFPVEFNRSPIGPDQGAPALVTIRDLTKWRRAQEALFREKEQAFVTLTSIADAVVAPSVPLTDAEGGVALPCVCGERFDATSARSSGARGLPNLCFAAQDQRRRRMLWTIALILVVLWLLGFFTGTGGGLIHLLLVIGIVVILIQVIQGRRV